MIEASFVIGFHTARIDNLLQTLHFLCKYHPEIVKTAQLVTLCQNTCEKLNESQTKELQEYLAAFGKTTHQNLNLEQMMLPKITNLGISLCESNKIIVLESDRILPPGYFASVIKQIQPGLMITTDKMHHLTEPATNEQIENRTYKSKDEFRSKENKVGFRNMWSGNTAIHKSDYYQAGQMDEEYIGYGWADCDMTNRMSVNGVKSVFRKEVELHLWHPKSTYGTGDQKKLFTNNCERYCKIWNVPIPDWARQDIAQQKKILM